MGSLENYRQIVRDVLTEYTRIPYSVGDLECEAVFDESRDRYLLMTVGWHGDRRVHYCLVHIDIINGKLWIQRDGIEHGIATELVEAGIPQSEIVLAFYPESDRALTDFALC